MYIVTPIIIGLLYWVYKQNCKYQIQLFSKTDSNKIKLLKYAYLAYTYFIPFSCSDGVGHDYFVYFVILGLVWLVPTLIICGIYYYIQSRKATDAIQTCQSQNIHFEEQCTSLKSSGLPLFTGTLDDFFIYQYHKAYSLIHDYRCYCMFLGHIDGI